MYPRLAWTCYVAEDNLELPDPLPLLQVLEIEVYITTSILLLKKVFMWRWAPDPGWSDLCVLGKHSNHWVTRPAPWSSKNASTGDGRHSEVIPWYPQSSRFSPRNHKPAENQNNTPLKFSVSLTVRERLCLGLSLPDKISNEIIYSYCVLHFGLLKLIWKE